MQRRADRSTEVQCTGIGFRRVNQIRERCIFGVAANDEHLIRTAVCGNLLEITEREIQPGQDVLYREAGNGDQKRIAVGPGVQNVTGTDGTSGTGDITDDDIDIGKIVIQVTREDLRGSSG